MFTSEAGFWHLDVGLMHILGLKPVPRVWLVAHLKWYARLVFRTSCRRSVLYLPWSLRFGGACSLVREEPEWHDSGVPVCHGPVGIAG